jgi:hypothetical protein
MEDFKTQAPQPYTVEIKREALAIQAAHNLKEMGATEVMVQGFRFLDEDLARDFGMRNRETLYTLAACCTWEQLQEAVQDALCDCIELEDQLCQEGLTKPLHELGILRPYKPSDFFVL